MIKFVAIAVYFEFRMLFVEKTAKGVLCNIHNEKNRGRVLQMKIKSAASLNLR